MSSAVDEKRRRAAAVLQRLETAYPDCRPLLEYADPYQLLIAVILSAQTTDAQVNRVTAALFAAYPTACALAEAGQAEVERHIHSTGFFRAKAQNIRGAALELCRRFDSQVPESMQDLLFLPGVGRKTANVVRGALFGKPAVIVDTHFARVVGRLEFSIAKSPDRLEREVAALLEPERHYSFSMRINYHGRYRCYARRPDCAGCEVRALCPYPG